MTIAHRAQGDPAGTCHQCGQIQFVLCESFRLARSGLGDEGMRMLDILSVNWIAELNTAPDAKTTYVEHIIHGALSQRRDRIARQRDT